MLDKLPTIANAKFPRTYEQARTALAQCANLDECKDWKDKAAALASYAKQADDDELANLARRIQARAVRRCGELLKEFDAQGRRSEPHTPEYTKSQSEVAAEAGMTKGQKDMALRIASIPEDQFEAQIESDEPPTITALAKQGVKPRKPAPDLMKGRDPAQFSAATHMLGAMKRLADKCGEHTPLYIKGGLSDHEIVEARKTAAALEKWLHQFVVKLKGKGK